VREGLRISVQGFPRLWLLTALLMLRSGGVPETSYCHEQGRDNVRGQAECLYLRIQHKCQNQSSYVSPELDVIGSVFEA